MRFLLILTHRGSYNTVYVHGVVTVDTGRTRHRPAVWEFILYKRNRPYQSLVQRSAPILSMETGFVDAAPTKTASASRYPKTVVAVLLTHQNETIK